MKKITTLKGNTVFLEDFQAYYETRAFENKSLYDIDDLEEETTSGDGKRGNAVALLSLLLAIPVDLLKDLFKDYLKSLFKRNVHSATYKLIGPSGELTITLNNQTIEEIEQLINDFKGEIAHIESI